MSARRRGPFRALVLASLCVALLAAALPVAAGEPPGSGRRVALVAREQPLAAFLQELFAYAEAPVSVSPALQGVVNGRFEGSVQSVFRDVARSFSMSAYYDGAAVHVYPASEVGTRTYATDPVQAARIQSSAVELGLPDSRNTLRIVQSGTLVAVGGPRFLQQMDELVRADGARVSTAAPTGRGTAPSPVAATPPIGFRVFFLRHAWAQDTRLAFGNRQIIVPGVASVLRSVTAGLGQTVAQQLPPGATVASADPLPAAASDRLLPPTQPKLKGSGLADAGRPQAGADAGGDPLAAGSVVTAPRAGGAVSAAGIGPDGSLLVPQRFVVNTIGAARIEADTRSNAVIVRDVTERLPMYEELIAALDVPPQMVEVEATIVDVNVTRLEQLGVNWRWVNGRNEVLFGNGTASDLLLRAGQQITPSGQGLFVSTVLGNGANFISRINALASDGAARVVSRPQLVTLSNVEALFDSNQTFYVRVAGREEVDLFNVSAGTSLRVTPNVFRDGDRWRIRMMVGVEDGRVTEQTVDAIPIVDRSTINTQALILEGESLLIGGMTRELRDRKADKVPVLGDLPVVGALFRNRTDTSQRIERLILITPRLIAADRALAAVVPRAEPAPAALSLPAPAPAPSLPAPIPTPRAAVAPAALPASGAAAPPTTVMTPSVQTWSGVRRPMVVPCGGPREPEC
jgi:type III secretion protein C